MTETQESNLRRRIASSNRFRTGLIAGAVILGLVLMCVIGLGIYAAMGLGAPGAVLPSNRSLQVGGRAAQPEVHREEAVEMPAMESDAAAGSYGVPGLPQSIERLIIRSGSISMVVEETRAVQGVIEEIVAGMAGDGAFVVSSNEYGGTEGSQPRITMSIRVPAARFDETMDRLAELAVEVTSRDESADDVTEEYVDLEARLESLEAARQRLLDIMAEARTTKDLLEAEQQLTQREAEIESIKGRMQYLEQSARLSSIWIELEPSLLSQPVGDQWRPAETVRRAVDALLDGLRSLGDFLIFFAIAVLPWLILLALAIYVVVRLVLWRARVRREKHEANQPPSS